MASRTGPPDVRDLGAQLMDPEVQSDVARTRKVITKIIFHMTQGVDSTSLFPEMVKMLASHDIIIKKMACLYIVRYAKRQPDKILLAVNTLVKDCVDPNPMMRGLALKTLCSLQQEALVEYAVQPVIKALHDKSAYVRRVAVTSCLKVSQISPSQLTEHGVVDQLYSMIRDSDPVVVSNCLTVLDEILRPEGGIVINRNIAHYLLNKLGIFTEWGLVTVFHLMQRYQPRTDDEVFDIMNISDSYLKHSNSAVVTSTLQFFLHLVRNLPHIHSELFQRARAPILRFLGAGNSELVYLILQFISSILEDHKDIFCNNHKAFFCKYSEPLYVKTMKVGMLPKLAREENVNEITEELGMYCTDINPALARCAIESIGVVCTTLPQQFDKCIDRLLQLVQLEIDYVTTHVLRVLKELDLKKHGNLEKALENLPQCVEVIHSEEGKCALMWLLGEYGDYLEESPYMLENYIDNLSEETSCQVKLHLLTACMKLFFLRPAECQDLLGRLMEAYLEDDNVDVRDRAVFYYRLLKQDVHKARKIVCTGID